MVNKGLLRTAPFNSLSPSFLLIPWLMLLIIRMLEVGLPVIKLNKNKEHAFWFSKCMILVKGKYSSLLKKGNDNKRLLIK